MLHRMIRATLALRDGDPSAIAFYADRGRIHVGDLGSCADQAYAAWAADRAAGLAILRELADEAAACLVDGLLATPDDIDVLAVTALGFPAWSGGPLSFLDMIARGEVDGLAPTPGVTPSLFYSE